MLRFFALAAFLTCLIFLIIVTEVVRFASSWLWLLALILALRIFREPFSDLIDLVTGREDRS